MAPALALLLSASGTGGSSGAVLYVPNRGQWDARAAYRADVPGGVAWLTARGLTLDLRDGARGHAVTFAFDGPAGPFRSGERAVETRNYFREAGSAQGVPTFRTVSRSLAPGIEQVFLSDRGAVRYDLRLAPGADPAALRLRVEGADSLTTDGRSLRIGTSLGVLPMAGLYAYQDGPEGRREVAVRLSVEGGAVRFRPGAYDRSRPLVIDPVLLSRYVGGTSDEEAADAARTPSGFVVASTVGDQELPETDGGYLVSTAGGGDVLLAAYDRNGVRTVATFYGGTAGDAPTGVAVAPDGGVRLVGYSFSKAVPTLPGALQRRRAGSYDAFVAHFSPGLDALRGATFVGGAKEDTFRDVAVNAAGDTVAVGWSTGTDLPTTAAAFRKTSSGGTDGYVTVISADGRQRRYASFFGGMKSDSVEAVTLAGDGEIVLAGHTTSIAGTSPAIPFPTTSGVFQAAHPDAGSDLSPFVARLSTTAGLRWCTYAGGVNPAAVTDVRLVGDDPVIAANAFNMAAPGANGFLTTPAGRDDVWLVRLSSNGARVVAATNLGGTQDDTARRLESDATGNLYLSGFTRSSDFATRVAPTDADAPAYQSGTEAFVVRVSPDLKRLRYVGLLTGSGNESAVRPLSDADGTVFLLGTTTSDNFPVIPAGSSASGGFADVFFARLRPGNVLARVQLDRSSAASGETMRATVRFDAPVREATTVRLWDDSPLTDLTSVNLVVAKGARSAFRDVKIVSRPTAATNVAIQAREDAATTKVTLRVLP